MNNIENNEFVSTSDYYQAIEGLPKRQREVLNLIAVLIKRNGYSPSLAELAEGINVRNRMTINQHLEALKRKGLVSWSANLKRSLKLTDAVAELLNDQVEDNNSNTIPFPKSKSEYELNVMGTISAGSGIDAIENPEKLDIESYYAKIGCYALKVKGDSMIDAGINDGDYVIVKPNPSPNNGDIVVALLEDGTATVKRFYKESNSFKLVPENPSMNPIIIDKSSNLTIQGIVVGLFRQF